MAQDVQKMSFSTRLVSIRVEDVAEDVNQAVVGGAAAADEFQNH